MRDAARAGLIALDFFILSVPGTLGSSALAFALATVLLIAVNVAVLWLWRLPSGPQPHDSSRVAGFLVAAAGATLAVIACRDWLHQIWTIPTDPYRADMLIVIQQGIRRVLQGRNPYTIYHVPWEATLPYGPVMWGPYVLPYALHFDVRFVSIAGELFVLIACAIAAAGVARSGEILSAIAWLAVVAAMTFANELHAFTPIAHTPSYWPLLALFAWLVSRERWPAAALLAGLLIVGRTTMVSLVPVLLCVVWFRDRRRFWTAALLVTAGAVLPYLAFFIADPRALAYALFGSYQHIMKDFVWTSTTWAHQTIGVTGFLLRAGWTRLVEPVQVAAMLAVYALAWRAIGRGDRPLPWLGLALLAFSVTTLWPVSYIYLDVFLLLASGAVAETEWFARRSLMTMWSGTLAATTALIAVMTAAALPRQPTVDVGSRDARPNLYAGFADDENGERGDRSFAWVDGDRARVLLPRRSRRSGVIEIVCQPNLPTAHAAQDMSAVLNGVLLGTVPLHEGWQTVTLPAPERAWLVGVNDLALSFSSAVSPLEAGTGADTRKLSVAFDRISVR